MDRRNWLRGLTALSLWRVSVPQHGTEGPRKEPVKVGRPAKNWKALWPKGRNVATSAEPLKLPDARMEEGRLVPAGSTCCAK